MRFDKISSHTAVKSNNLAVIALDFYRFPVFVSSESSFSQFSDSMAELAS